MKNRMNRLLLFTVFSLLMIFSVQAQWDLPPKGLLLYLDASVKKSIHIEEDKVERWDNLAPGFSNSFTSESGKSPAFVPQRSDSHNNWVLFDGYDDVLRDLNFFQQSETFTLVAQIVPFRSYDYDGIISACPKDGQDYDPGFDIELHNANEEFDYISVEGVGRIGKRKDQKVDKHGFYQSHVIMVERDKNEIRVFVNGKEQNTRPVHPGTTIMEELRVGARFYSGLEKHHFFGAITKIVLYNRILETKERLSIEQSFFVSDTVQKAELEYFKQWEEKLLTQNKRAMLEAEKGRMIAPKVIKSWENTSLFNNSKDFRQSSLAQYGFVEQLPVRTDLHYAIALASQHLLSLFDADKNNEPFFWAMSYPDGRAVFEHLVELDIPHVTGRSLLGTLMVEELVGLPVPQQELSILEEYCKISFDNKDHLNSYIDQGERFIEMHHMREGLYGLLYLIKSRDSQWAREKVQKMLRTLDAITNENGWSNDLVEKYGAGDRVKSLHPLFASRMVEPLMAYYRLTQNSLALKLASIYTKRALKDGYEKDGTFKRPWQVSSGHIHSITCTLTGMTDLAIHQEDKELLDLCMKIMDNGVPQYHSSWGWGDEFMPDCPHNTVSRGEINQTADVVRTALLLGANVDPDYYEIAERFVRSMILPTQYHEKDLRAFVKEIESPTGDKEFNVIKRCIGGQGMQLPNDRMGQGEWVITTPDITSGMVHSLAEVWNHRMVVEGNVCKYNMMFDVVNEDFEINSFLPLEGKISFIAKTGKDFWIRLPKWVDRNSLVLTVQRNEQFVNCEGSFLKVTGLEPGIQGELVFDVPCKIEKETVDGTEYTTTWVGNQVVEILPRGDISPLPF